MSSTAVGCVVPSVLRSEKNEEPISSVQWEEGGGGAPVPERIIPDTPEKLPSSLHKHTVFLMQPV